MVLAVLPFLPRAIHDAVETGMLEMVRVLVEHGADPCTEYLDKTPCEIAQALGHTEIHKYLRGKWQPAVHRGCVLR